jgi:hypothetical protein
MAACICHLPVTQGRACRAQSAALCSGCEKAACSGPAFTHSIFADARRFSSLGKTGKTGQHGHCAGAGNAKADTGIGRCLAAA